MRVSAKAVSKVMEFEGFKARSYKCPAGVQTIGYGHTKDVRKYQQCTKAQAHAWLLEDLAEAGKGVQSTGLSFTQGQYDSLCDFVFNLGLRNLLSSTLLKKIKAGSGEEEIRKEFKRWVYAGGDVLPGLVRRREWEADRYFEKD